MSTRRPSVQFCVSAAALALLAVIPACSASRGTDRSALSSTSTTSGSPSNTSHGSASPGVVTPPPSGKPAGSSGNPSGIAIGIFVRSTGSNDTSNLSSLLAQLGRTPAIIQTFQAWQAANGSYNPFPRAFADFVSSRGAIPMITWQPGQNLPNAGQSVSAGTHSPKPEFSLHDPAYSLSALAGGSQDNYVTQWAQAARSWGRPIYVRLMHEPNERNYPWAVGVNGNANPAQYVAAFQHIVGLFEQVGATNVQFVWCLGVHSTDGFSFGSFYPGDRYAQWAALDGYNRDENQGWQTIDQIFGEPYAQIASFSHRPIMIAETGSVEDPSNPQAKADWISTGLLTIIPQDFPRVKAVLYFDAPGRNYTYPLSSSPQALDAFKTVMAASLYQATAPAVPESD